MTTALLMTIGIMMMNNNISDDNEDDDDDNSVLITMTIIWTVSLYVVLKNNFSALR